MNEDPPIIKKPRKTLQEHIRESGYDLAADMFKLNANIKYRQLIMLMPSLLHGIKGKLVKSFRISSTRVQQNLENLMYAEQERNEIISTRAQSQVYKQDAIALIDCGASKTIVSKRFLDALGIEIDSSSTTIFTLGNGNTCPSLGIV
ncbi:hypothetical protein BD560DRAFT_319080, partial [Blakeslea trispora]